MKVAGILILTLAIQINSIVCSVGWERSILPPRKIVSIPAENLTGVHIMLPAGGMGPVEGTILAVKRGDDVIGWLYNYMIQPIFNAAHHKITKNLVNGMAEEISDELAQKLGVYSYLPGKPRRYRSRSPRPGARKIARQNELELQK